MGEKPRGEYKDLQLQLLKYEEKAREVIDKIPFFTWEAFEKKYLQNRGATDTVSLAYDDKIKLLTEAGRIGYAVNFECAQGSLNRFNPNLKFADITPELLEKYERSMLELGNSKTTISMYLRTLRTLFNDAIHAGDIVPELYPFRKNERDVKKYQIPEARNIKKALKMSEIAKIFNYKAKAGSYREMAKDYWIFIYLSNGINVKDLCRLRFENISGKVLTYTRAKTSRQKTAKQIQVILRPESLAIIKKWGNKKKDNKTFVFPVLTGKETPEKERQLVQQLTRVINDNMRKIAEELEINQSTTSYAARHSFATILKRSGANNTLISELLGHSNLKTTQSYLDSFEKDYLEEQTNALTDFSSLK